MEFNQVIPLQLRQPRSEGSIYAPERDDRNVSQSWKKSQIESRQTESLVQAIQTVSREVSRRRRRIVGGGATNPPSNITQYKITTIPGSTDYIMAKTWDGTNLGTTEIAIAKKFECRCSVTNVTILGTAITYVYSDDNHRTSSDGVNPTQSEELWTPFEVGSGSTNGTFYASLVSNGTGIVDGSGNPIMWVDNTARVWGKYA